MCGIGITIKTISPSCSEITGHMNPEETGDNRNHESSSIEDSIWRSISPRGPDFRQRTSRVISSRSNQADIEINFFVSVLHLRGLTLTQQPIRASETGNLLLWNGEVFDGLSITDVENDGQAVLYALENRGNRTIPGVFLGIEGPYAFIYHDVSLNQIWFGRDPLGRRSLMRLEEGDSSQRSTISLASHYDGQATLRSSELATDSFFYVDLNNAESLCTIEVPRGSPPIILNRQIPLESDRVSSSSTWPTSLTTATSRFRDSLNTSLRRRLVNISTLYQTDAHDSKVAILFSGGLDCTTLALLAHSHIPLTESIDLVNVAFENTRAAANSKRSNNQTANPDVFSVPDRRTGEESWKELCQLTPGRIWRFVEVDVRIVDYLKYKDQIIELMWPNDTVMDLSIAAALFFAAWGIGSCRLNPDSDECIPSYSCPARVFLSGLGADELLGGYSRHRSAFTSESPWPNLIEELQLDIDRIPTRNLGRDDRIIAHHGREVRYPFLDRDVILSLANLPVHLKCDLSLKKGTGDKLLLRVLAQELGLSQASQLVKRAIQFGARSAKLEGLEKGTAQVRLNGLPSSTTHVDTP
ncbi:hypothetical protein PSTG_07365 [Puccinia striiformis f. sp. tritici PST-78]|uniref:Asparagine synthetase domain-containing protein n=1 Tax=Puccinia striiformis f. sp. tritici PST-78 TaxID=1165861 RepID=A0A0L0VJJ1_9BASI|nr:hypothetical protein PSTG_07365 [Puccinia striiformis f. sp. tritici PST-78]